jgi:hypothetical protein
MTEDEEIFAKDKMIAKGQSRNKLISHLQHCTFPLLLKGQPVLGEISTKKIPQADYQGCCHQSNKNSKSVTPREYQACYRIYGGS